MVWFMGGYWLKPKENTVITSKLDQKWCTYLFHIYTYIGYQSPCPVYHLPMSLGLERQRPHPCGPSPQAGYSRSTITSAFLNPPARRALARTGCIGTVYVPELGYQI